ncbi:MAG: hypothetical protein M1447_00140 [Gammaproteobacteria bacterium]|nr:hypothetical protein [Gammaproteobacteria bacterium]
MIIEASSRLLLPSLDELESVLSNLMDAPLLADRYRKGSPLPEFYLVGLYCDQNDVLRSLIQVDFSFALYCGARLSLIPAGVIEESKASGELTDTIVANVHEILNIFGLLFNEQRPNAPRARLTKLVLVDELPEEGQELLRSPGLQGIDVAVSWRDRRPVGALSIRLLPKAPVDYAG